MAVELYRQAGGRRDGKVWPGICYSCGRGGTYDEASAVELCRRAADAGDATGTRRHCCCCSNGWGVGKGMRARRSSGRSVEASRGLERFTCWYDFNGRIQLLQTAAKTREASMKI
jgi:TPR repeat protein